MEVKAKSKLPFVRFAFNRMHIPAHGAIDRDGRFSWVETVIVTFDKELADTASQDEFYCVRRYPINSGLPEESVQYKGHKYPNSVMPDRYRRIDHSLTVKPTREIEAERKAMAGLYQKVEGLGAKIRKPVT